jgi:hypothetical protein
MGDTLRKTVCSSLEKCKEMHDHGKEVGELLSFLLILEYKWYVNSCRLEESGLLTIRRIEICCLLMVGG